MKWDLIIGRVVTVYFYWAALTAVYFIAKKYVSVTRSDKLSCATTWEKAWTYTCCIVILLFIGGLAGHELGTHREGGDIDDPGEVVADFEPTDVQRWSYEAKIFLVLLPVSLLGLRAGYEQDKKLTPEERRRLSMQIKRDSASSDY